MNLSQQEFDLLKAILPIILASILAAALTLKWNDSIKRREILYKERIEGFKDIAKRLTDLRAYGHMLHDKNTSNRHELSVKAVVEKLKEIEIYIDFEYEAKLFFFSQALRDNFSELRKELKGLLDIYIAYDLDDNWTDYQFKREKLPAGLDSREIDDLANYIFGCIIFSETIINQMVKELRISSRHKIYSDHSKWIYDRKNNGRKSWLRGLNKN